MIFDIIKYGNKNNKIDVRDLSSEKSEELVEATSSAN